MSRINLVGLEVEGGWDGTAMKRPFDLPIIQDHSVDGRTVQSDKPLTCPHVGEVVSKPLACDPDVIGAWLDKYWPQHTNITCGYHIHVSLKNIKDYSALTTKNFLHKVILDMKKLGREMGLPPTHYFWGRIAGSNPFCTLNFDSSSQISMKQKSVGDRTRYGMLNYAWNIHGTVEFRALPTFETADQARAFTFCYLNSIEDFLEEHSQYSCQYTALLTSKYGNIDFKLFTSEVN